MPRPLRVEFPNAWYHIMNHGRRGEEIYKENSDYETFLKLLLETTVQFDLQVSAYCLIPDNYHLLVQTPRSNISRCMRHINGVYTQRYNRAYQRDSQLFRGRYKSILIEEDAYLLEVLRYIHRYPIKAGLEKSLGTYHWSSHYGYLSSAKKWDWLHKDALLKLFSSTSANQIRLYKSFMAKEVSEPIRAFYKAKKLSPVVGSDGFVQQIRQEYLEKISHHEFPELKEMVPSEELVFSKVCQHYQVDKSSLLRIKRGQSNEARDVAIFLIRDLRYTSYQLIADIFRVNTPSAISSSTARVRKRMENDLKFRKNIQKLKNAIKTN